MGRFRIEENVPDDFVISQLQYYRSISFFHVRERGLILSILSEWKSVAFERNLIPKNGKFRFPEKKTPEENYTAYSEDRNANCHFKMFKRWDDLPENVKANYSKGDLWLKAQ